MFAAVSHHAKMRVFSERVFFGDNGCVSVCVLDEYEWLVVGVRVSQIEVIVRVIKSFNI